MKDGMRILWKSNAPHVGSGYGVQANSLLPRLAQHPSVEEIGIFGYFGIAGGLCTLPVGVGIPGVTPKTMLHYPVAGDMWGNDVVWDHARHFDAHVVITLLDAWVLKPDYGHGGFLWVPYAPVDHDPIPPKVLARLQDAFHPIAYSEHGAREFARNGLDHHYIPHGVETKIYRPFDKGGKKAAKKWLGFDEDTFLIGTVAANKGWPARKGFAELFEAFAILHDKYPNARLFLHSAMTDQQTGMSLPSLAKVCGINDYVRFSAPYLHLLGFDAREMAHLYNAMDVFCLPSMGEGFGIPIVEAQACGVPVIVTDWTACAELCGSGWKVPIDKKILTPLDSYQAFADVGALAEAMESAYKMWKNPEINETMSKGAREFAMGYDWEPLVRDIWFPFMDWLWERVRPKSIMMPAMPQEPTTTNGAQPPTAIYEVESVPATTVEERS